MVNASPPGSTEAPPPLPPSRAGAGALGRSVTADGRKKSLTLLGHPAGSLAGRDSPSPTPRFRRAESAAGGNGSFGVGGGANVAKLKAELSVCKLTLKALRKILGDASAGARVDADGRVRDPSRVLHDAAVVLAVADDVVHSDDEEEKDDDATTKPHNGDRAGDAAVTLSLAEIGDQAKDFLAQYDSGGGALDEETFDYGVRRARAADAAAATTTATANGTGVPTRAPLKTAAHSRAHSHSHAAAAAAGDDDDDDGDVAAEIRDAVCDWDTFDTIAFDERLRAARDVRRGRASCDDSETTSTSTSARDAQQPSRILRHVVGAVVDRFDLLEANGVRKDVFTAFLVDLEKAYKRPDYHTATHAADVTHALAVLLERGLLDQITPMQALAIVVAAAAHDVGHEGLSNAHLVTTAADVATRWNDVSVNENGHAHVTLGLLKKHGVLESFDREAALAFRAIVRRLILATDMENHTHMMSDFVAMADAADGAPVMRWKDPTLAMCYALHVADISSPARREEVAEKWAERITEEFYKQGDKERALGMTPVAFCDRTLATPTSRASNQLHFIDYVCKPCIEILATTLPDAAELMLRHLTRNREMYRRMCEEDTTAVGA